MRNEKEKCIGLNFTRDDILVCQERMLRQQTRDINFTMYNVCNVDDAVLMPEPCPICADLNRPLGQVQRVIDRLSVTRLQGTSEWQSKRSEMFTASDVPALLGHNHFKTADEVIDEKIHGKTFQGNAATAWGQSHEDEACEEFKRRTGHKVAHTGLMVHADINWLGGSPDGITYCGHLLEIKTPYSAAVPRVSKTVPPMYRDQLNTLLAITELQGAFFVRYRPPNFLPRGVPCEGKEMEYNCVYWRFDRDWLSTNLPLLESQRAKLSCDSLFADMNFLDACVVTIESSDN